MKDEVGLSCLLCISFVQPSVRLQEAPFRSDPVCPCKGYLSYSPGVRLFWNDSQVMELWELSRHQPVLWRALCGRYV